MKPAVYPDSFFIAHRLFTGAPFPAGGTWGDVLDGPIVGRASLAKAIYASFKSDETWPTEGNLRVWVISPGEIAEDCTAGVIEDVHNTLAARRS